MKSAALMCVGAALILGAVVMNDNASEKERIMGIIEDGNRSAHRMQGRQYESSSYKKDRMPVYLLLGLGGIAIIAGIATIGSNRNDGARRQ